SGRVRLTRVVRLAPGKSRGLGSSITTQRVSAPRTRTSYPAMTSLELVTVTSMSTAVPASAVTRRGATSTCISDPRRDPEAALRRRAAAHLDEGGGQGALAAHDAHGPRPRREVGQDVGAPGARGRRRRREDRAAVG